MTVPMKPTTKEARAREVLARHGIVEGFSTPLEPGYVAVVDPDAIIAAMLEFAADAGPGWIVGDNAGRWRTFDSFGWAWADRRDLAVRYARRQDAELVHADDEDSWRVEQYPSAPASTPHDSAAAEALAREVLAAEYEATAPAGKYVARDIRSGNLTSENQRTIRAMLAYAASVADRPAHNGEG